MGSQELGLLGFRPKLLGVILTIKREQARRCYFGEWDVETKHGWIVSEKLVLL
jgi:hypothetical protein